MDGMRLPDFSDLFGGRFAGRIRRERKRPVRAPSQRTPRDAIADEGFLPLVDEDGLVFRCQIKTANVSSRFRQAFREVWERIPPADCQRMLGYWRARSVEIFSCDHVITIPAHAKPLIQVVDGESPSPTPQRLGHELSFPAALVLGEPDLLTLEIARALVHVYRYATRDYWRLVGEQIEDPLERWERARKAEPKWKTRERKLDELEAAYLGMHEAAVISELCRWGFA